MSAPAMQAVPGAPSAAPRPSLYPHVIVWLLLLSAPVWLPLVGSYVQLGSEILIFALTAMALNLMLGYTGVLSFGQAAYFGLGAYGCGLALLHLMPNTLVAVLCGTILGGVIAFLLGPFLMRRRGVYFAMITIAFSQMFYFIASRWDGLTGGQDGLTGFSRLPIHLGLFTASLKGTSFYYFVLFFFAVGTGVIAALLHSPLGHSWVAIRENVRRTRYLGLKTDYYIWAVFTISGFLCALGGTLEALLNNFTSPQDLYWQISGNFVIMAVLGGMRSFWGPLVGAALFILLQDYLSSYTHNWQTFLGLVFVIVVLAFPNGLLGLAKRRLSGQTEKTGAKA